MGRERGRERRRGPPIEISGYATDKTLAYIYLSICLSVSLRLDKFGITYVLSDYDC